MPLINNFRKFELGQRMSAAQSVVDNAEADYKAAVISQLNAQKSALQNIASSATLTATEQNEYDTLIADIDAKITALNT